ncbi:MAG: glucosamine-6-phosphate deaminase [Clostridiales bacterium]|jgi:glucosamine-6-phosphate deaminase|nr:glucosamine-6-phosphate deaminase [Clostridiales bacterium]
MNMIRCGDYEALSHAAAEFVARQIKEKPSSVLGLPTGATPLGMYSRLVALCRNEALDFSGVTTFNLDEYYPIKRDDRQSYYYFMHTHLFSGVNIKKENVHIPNGETADPEAECAGYERRIAQSGGIDLQVLGIGQNGHIGFIEPGEALESATHVTALTPNTIAANARFFESAACVPTKALTMGIGTIMRARKILILVSGKEKTAPLQALADGKITPKIPATILNAHGDVTLITDQPAF